MSDWLHIEGQADDRQHLNEAPGVDPGARRLTQSHGPANRLDLPGLDLPGLGLAGVGLFGLTFGIVRATSLGSTSPSVVAAIGTGVVLLAAFLWCETRTEPRRCSRCASFARAFSASNGVSFVTGKRRSDAAPAPAGSAAAVAVGGPATAVEAVS